MSEMSDMNIPTVDQHAELYRAGCSRTKRDWLKDVFVVYQQECFYSR